MKNKRKSQQYIICRIPQRSDPFSLVTVACQVTACLGTMAAAVAWHLRVYRAGAGPEGTTRGHAGGYTAAGERQGQLGGAFPCTQLAGAQVEAKHRGPLTTCGGCNETGGWGSPGGACLS